MEHKRELFLPACPHSVPAADPTGAGHKYGHSYHPAVRFELIQRIGAPVEAVEAAYVDPEFLVELGRLPKLGHTELLEQQDRGNQVWQRVRYTFVGELSPAVKAVVDPKKLTWVEESTLDRTSHTTTFVMVPDNYARLLESSGEITLASEGAGALRRSTGDLTVNVPFLGRKVESAIISGLREHAKHEVDVVERWVAKHD
jgi:Protein of unknown function (DUF2505)